MVLVAALAAACPAWQAQRVDPAQQHNRVIAIVPTVVDSGGLREGVRRPKYVEGKAAWVLCCYSQDGSLALGEFVALDREGHAALRADRDARTRVFEKGAARFESIRAAARAAGFRAEDVERFLAKAKVVVP
jgi:hypothetical protein